MRYIGPRRAIFLFAGFSLWLASAQTTVQNAATSELTVRGDIPAPLTLKADDLARMPRETVSVPDQDGTKVNYEGVPLQEILKRAGVPLGKDLRGKGSNPANGLKEGQVLHRVVLSVSRPEPCAVQHGGCGNQGIAEFHRVALSVASEGIACQTACCRVNRNTFQRTEQVVECVLFRRARARPEFGGGDRRIEDDKVGTAQLGPS